MDVEEVLNRAEAHWYDDLITQKRVVVSRNTEAPLTEEEQNIIRMMWSMRNPIPIEFRVGGV